METRQLFDKYVANCPFAVLTQVAVRSLVRDDLDAIFETHRSRQYNREVAFSDLATAVADVAMRCCDNFNQSYKKHKEQLGISLTCFYDKINCTELAISEAIVRHSAERAVPLQDELGFVPWEPLPGYRVYALDGNHLQETDKRLKPLRELHDAPLAGTVVARFDLQRRLFDRAYLLEDAHAQESSTHERVTADLQPGDLLLADRHYCVLAFLKSIDRVGASFVIRQHGRFHGVLVGKRRKVGRSATGMVYEQEILTSDKPDAFRMRRITVELDEPTRDGATEVHILTNLAIDVDAIAIADLYRLRWEEEVGFNHLTMTLTCELKSVSQPKAALFLFCMAMLSYNVRQVDFAALYAEHDDATVDEFSNFHISKDVSQHTPGMLVAIDESMWAEIIPARPAAVARLMRRIARSIDVKQYKKNRRGPKKKVVKPKRTRNKTHVSTAKILAEARK